jgi:Protein of unknown function (DUF3489)/Amidase
MADPVGSGAGSLGDVGCALSEQVANGVELHLCRRPIIREFGLEVAGCDTGKRYLIYRGRVFTIQELDADGEIARLESCGMRAASRRMTRLGASSDAPVRTRRGKRK